jgi:hypothetical protein
MENYTLTVIDTTGIQDYIFGSNVLKHNVGASALVHWATNDWLCEKLVELGETNVDKECKFTGRTIDGDGLVSELIYAGGGNTAILFKNYEIAKEFTKRLTKKVLLDAPGLQLVIAHSDIDWDKKKDLPKKVQRTITKVNEKKTNRVHSSPVLGLGITADCQFTGLPAVKKYKDDDKLIRISAEVKAKLNAFDQAHKRLIDFLELEDYSIQKELDSLGRTKGESSYIAIVHTDGNGMGRRIQNIGRDHPENRDYINAIRAFSESIKDAASNALKSSINAIINSILPREVDGREFIGETIEIKRDKKQDKKILPIRPIVFGGDDTTFICDGRLGLTLTEFYLRQLTSQNLADGKGPLFARAGVAVVKSHYPFARAYSLAEELAVSAKKFIKEKDTESKLSAIDWHFAVSGLVLGLDEIRERDYHTSQGYLTMRPLILSQNIESEWRTWNTFTNIISELQGIMGQVDNTGTTEGQWSRNKLKALRTVLRESPESVKQYLVGNKPDKLPLIPGNRDSDKKGWIGDRCTCFDAIEAMDFYVPLKEDA